jgi:hypothetical protein
MRNPKPKRKTEKMNKPPRDRSCETSIDIQLFDRMLDLGQLWVAYHRGDDGAAESLAGYGLCFDFVPPGTFSGQTEAYFRYQLSWGGPSDEFRFFVNPDFSCHRIEYWFLDWFDGAGRTVSGQRALLLLEIWEWFRETGAVEAAHERSAV